LIADIKELGSPSGNDEISDHQLRIIEISRDVALLQRARNDARKKKRLAEQNLATNPTTSSNSIVAGLFPALRPNNPSPASVVSSAFTKDDDEVMSPAVAIPVRVRPQSRDTFRPPSAKPIVKHATRTPFRYGSRYQFDQLMQETFGEYGQSNGLSSRYITKIPVDHGILEELSTIRRSLQKGDDTACLDRWIILLAESIEVSPNRYGVPLSLYEEHLLEQDRLIVGDSLRESATFVDTSLLESATFVDSTNMLMQYIDPDLDARDDDLNDWHEDAPGDFGPMVEEK